MKSRHRSLVTMGITSLLLIFSVLCMVILALLTFGSSHSDLTMSKRSIEQTTAYYHACYTATDLCRETEEELYQIRSTAAEEKDYYSNTASLCSLGFSWEEDSRMLTAEISYSDRQALYLELQVLYPQNPEDPVLEIHKWQTISTGEWNPDTRQPVYSSGLPS